ncbi:gliding motility-associated C-terminal domain-containing protein [Siphonobacter aquaeclarae]|uniref:Gliding motility-associated C-terminal domain-containing protein n=2 Tax=Siphonobacter aquaeclarae TaxID=563176 RepID=A0A1G9RU39_9BACT|nr:gliding motility-associated C-terminal domain-containing protein [Siphonobacter aquaeclarae]
MDLPAGPALLMKKLYLFTILCLLPFLTRGTHIVGGEIQMEELKNATNGATHRITLNLYFDDINGNVGADDPTVVISIFRKRDNARMGDLEMPRIFDQIIPYSNPLCASAGASLRTRLIRYSSDVIFRHQAFDDAQGYYIVWERCCRNNVISNIVRPQDAGTVFYLEIPPLFQNNRIFNNSSPQFTVVKGDYICLNRPFTFDFSATDPDGDSLRYSLVTPLNGFSTPGTPRPLASPSSSYPAVTWGGGYSAALAIPGNPPLAIDPRSGKLSVTASQLGLYVFSVMIEEFRSGKRIGVVRRDFQLKVIDCPAGNPPVVMAREDGKTQYYRQGEIIRMKAGEKRCLNLYFTDKDPRSRLSLKVRALIPNPLTFTLAPSEVVINTGKDTASAQICLGECAESADGRPVQFQVIASDESCPLPQQDTLTVSVLVEPRPNQKPTVSTTLPGNQTTVPFGTPVAFRVDGLDLDPDSIRLEARGRGFSLASVGMTFPGGKGYGKAQSPFTWNPPCAAVRDQPYIVDFYVIDLRCGRNLTDSVSVSLKATGRPSQPPSVSTTLPGNKATVVLEGTTGEPIRFDVAGVDPDSDPLTVKSAGRGFSLGSAGMQWSDLSGTGRVSGPFEWIPSCDLLEGLPEKTFTVDFVTEDNSCNPNRFDTVSVELTIRDRVTDYAFLPPNVITPNNDGKNDFFYVDDLPKDNCIQQFEYVEIFNRWGKQVYRDTKRTFRWGGENLSTGQYYYVIRYTKQQFKGVVSILR